MLLAILEFIFLVKIRLGNLILTVCGSNLSIFRLISRTGLPEIDSSLPLSIFFKAALMFTAWRCIFGKI